MRGLLQKPWFVGLLAAAALFFVYTNLIEPLIPDNSGSGSIVADLSNNLPFISGTNNEPEKKEVRKADWDALNQIDQNRNPFSPVTIEKIIKKLFSKKINWPTVTAIVIGASDSFAIVNGKVVQQGQKAGKFKIVKISANSVRVRSGSHEKTLTLNARGGR